jgi:hypothetical protein
MFLEFVNCIAVIGISFRLHPILKKYNETLAKGYIGFRILESLIVVIGKICLLPLLSLSQEFDSSGTLDASYYLEKGRDTL